MQTCSRACYYIPNAYLCACVSAFINREEETTEARKVQRERYDGGDINDLSMDNLSLVFLRCKNLSQIF